MKEKGKGNMEGEGLRWRRERVIEGGGKRKKEGEREKHGLLIMIQTVTRCH